MPRIPVTRQQQMQERIILAQTPAWLSDPAASSGVASSSLSPSHHQPGGGAGAGGVSLLRRVADVNYVAPQQSPSRADSSVARLAPMPGALPSAAVDSPNAAASAVADSALYETFKRPVGRVEASSPFPAHNQQRQPPLPSRTPPPQIANGSHHTTTSPLKADGLVSPPSMNLKGASSPLAKNAFATAMSGTASPTASKAVGFRTAGASSPTATAADSSSSGVDSPMQHRGMLTVDSNQSVVHGAPPRMQGLSAILTSGPLPKSAPPALQLASPTRRLAPMSRQGTSQSNSRSTLPSRQGGGAGMGMSMLLSSSYNAGPDASFMLRVPSSQQPSRSGHPATPAYQPPPNLRTTSRSQSPASRGTSPAAARKPPVFLVPDLSDMDPFSLMERGLVEELARFRSNPQGYFEEYVLPDIAVELPAPPEAASGSGAGSGTNGKDKAGGGLHPALVPRCIADVLARARELRRREHQRQQEHRQILQREAEFNATHSDIVILGGPQLAPRRHSTILNNKPTITVPLEAAEVYADALHQAVQDIKKGASIATGGHDDDGSAPNSPAKGRGKPPRGAAADAALASSSVDKPSPAQRRAAVELLQRHLDDVETLVLERQAAVAVLRDFNEAHLQERLRNADPEGAAKKPPKPSSPPLSSKAGRRSRTPSPSSGGGALRLRDHTPSSDDGYSPRPQPGGADASTSVNEVSSPSPSSGPIGLPKVAYIKGLCMAARDLAELLSLSAASAVAAMQAAQGWPGGIIVDDAASPQRTTSNRVPTLTTVEKLSSQYGKVTESITAYVIYGLWHQPQSAVAALLQQWLDNACKSHPSQVPIAAKGAADLTVGQGNDSMLLYPSRLNAGAAWQRHATHGAVTVILLSSGFQEVSYIKQHRNLPVIELRRCFNTGQMGKQERVYDLTFIPEHYEIRAVKPLVHPLVCGRRVEVVVELPRHVLLSCAIETGAVTAQPGRSMTTTFVDRVGKYAKLHAVLMEPTAARLVVFARHPSELQYRRASTVLLKPSSVLWAAADDGSGGGGDGSFDIMGSSPQQRPHSPSVASAAGVQLASLAAVDRVLSGGVGGAGSAATNGSASAVFPEQFEFFQARQGFLLCPRAGEVIDASTAASDGAENAVAAAVAFLPPGVTLGPTSRAALASGGTLVSFRCDAECQQATVIGTHGTTQLHRVPCWGYGLRAELKPRPTVGGSGSRRSGGGGGGSGAGAPSGAGGAEPPNLSWFFGVVKVKQGFTPVSLWIDGQCALQWSVAEPV